MIISWYYYGSTRRLVLSPAFNSFPTEPEVTFLHFDGFLDAKKTIFFDAVFHCLFRLFFCLYFLGRSTKVNTISRFYDSFILFRTEVAKKVAFKLKYTILIAFSFCFYSLTWNQIFFDIYCVIKQMEIFYCFYSFCCLFSGGLKQAESVHMRS